LARADVEQCGVGRADGGGLERVVNEARGQAVDAEFVEADLEFGACGAGNDSAVAVNGNCANGGAKLGRRSRG